MLVVTLVLAEADHAPALRLLGHQMPVAAAAHFHKL